MTCCFYLINLKNVNMGQFGFRSSNYVQFNSYRVLEYSIRVLIINYIHISILNNRPLYYEYCNGFFTTFSYLSELDIWILKLYYFTKFNP